MCRAFIRRPGGFSQEQDRLDIFLRPVKISDEPLLKELFYSLSTGACTRGSPRLERTCLMPAAGVRGRGLLPKHGHPGPGQPRGEGDGCRLGQYSINQDTLTAELALVVRDEYQHQGIGKEIQSYLTLLARRNGLQGFAAEVLEDNSAALSLLERMGFEMVSGRWRAGDEASL